MVDGLSIFVSVATPAEPRGEKGTLLVQILAGAILLGKCGEKFVSCAKGA